MKTKHQNSSQGEAVTERIGRHWRAWLLVACAGVAGIGLAMTWARVRAAERSEDGLWEQSEQVAQQLRERGEIPARARVFRLEEARLTRVLAGRANSNEKDRGDRRGVITLPMPEGAFERVRLEDVQVMEPALAARFPEIKNYRGESVERGAWSLRMTHSPQGLSAFVTDGERTVSIQPMEVDGARYYVSAWGQDYEAVAGEARCLVGETELRGQGELARRTSRRNLRAFAPPVGATKRTYRIAIATTAQYVTDFGGSSSAQASLTTWVNVLNGIFEKELSVAFTLVTNTNVMGNAQFNGLSLSQMADKSREVLQQNVGLANYDLGLVFGTGATSGLSYIGAVCENGGDGGFAYKGGGAVLFATVCGVGCNAGNDTGAGMLAHEVGHLFGATHTFNADNAQCNPTTRVPETAYESGGGLTLMSNAGNCAGNDIAAARALHFHSGSFEQMAALINDNFGGCATVSNNNNNNPPTVSGGADYVIPKLTPFTLTATGNDTDGGDVPNLTYVWEEMDAGGAFPNPPYTDQASDPPETTRPLFRSFAPAANGASRTFPSLNYIK
ncbi:MAG TPA: M12 family metallo-peptidase, partial [Blastocatellia bacterium]